MALWQLPRKGLLFLVETTLLCFLRLLVRWGLCDAEKDLPLDFVVEVVERSAIFIGLLSMILKVCLQFFKLVE